MGVFNFEPIRVSTILVLLMICEEIKQPNLP